MPYFANDMRQDQRMLDDQQDQLTALKSCAASFRAQADAAKFVATIGQKPLIRIAAVEEARRLAAGGADTKAETAVERMRRVASLAEKPTTDNIS